MKRIVAIFLALALLLGLAACGGADVKNVKVDLGSSERFSEAERQAAVDFVMKQFKTGYEGCTLKRIYYDETESLRLAKSYIDEPQYPIYGMDPNDIIVLFSDFHTPAELSGGFTPDEDYNGWSWYLIRDGKGEPWREYTHGFA